MNTMLSQALPQHIPHGLHLGHLDLHAALNLLCLSTSRTDCIASDEVETEEAAIFASAHPARIASNPRDALAKHVDLCLSTSRTDCISKNARIQCYEIVQCAVRW